MTYQKGHVSYKPIVKGNEVVTWSCRRCGVQTSKTWIELGYRSKVPVFCSNKCRYAVGPRTGMVTSEETKMKLRLQKLGNKNPSWRGGVTSVRLSLMNTQEYKAWRKSVYERDDYTCQKCGERGGRLEADHITPYMMDKSKLLDVNNGQTLCKLCHREKTRAEQKLHWKNQYTEITM